MWLCEGTFKLPQPLKFQALALRIMFCMGLYLKCDSVHESKQVCIITKKWKCQKEEKLIIAAIACSCVGLKPHSLCSLFYKHGVVPNASFGARIKPLHIQTDLKM